MSRENPFYFTIKIQGLQLCWFLICVCGQVTGLVLLDCMCPSWKIQVIHIELVLASLRCFCAMCVDCGICLGTAIRTQQAGNDTNAL